MKSKFNQASCINPIYNTIIENKSVCMYSLLCEMFVLGWVVCVCVCVCVYILDGSVLKTLSFRWPVVKTV